jgi:hypothetical protein
MISHTQLQYLPIPIEIAQEARLTLKDRFGHSLASKKATGPCRVCLTFSTVPSELILLSYQPLADRNPYAEIGPIFIHANECVPYATRDRFPQDFASRELVVRAYDVDGNIHDALVAAPGTADDAARAFLDDPAVTEVHVRHNSYTCFAFKIVRNPNDRATVVG